MLSTPSDKSSKHSPEQQEERLIRVVLLAEDRITRAGVRILIEKESGMIVVGEHEPIDDAGTVLTSACPHVTLVDIDRSSREFIPELIARLSKKTCVIVLTSTDDPEMVSSVFWS